MRLFTALDLPADVGRNLEELLRRLKPAAQISWSRPENLHITIKFIGELAEARIGELTQALARVPRRAAIPVRVRRVGFHPNAHSPHNFWCGIEAPGLDALAADTDAAIAAVGVARETKAFSPHLTLARIKRHRGLEALREAIAGLPSLEFGAFEARSFFLYQSVLKPTGSVYTKLSEFPAPPVMTQLLVLVIAYLLGAIPFGYLLVKWKTGADVRSQGSGNIGATNVMRTSGRAVGIATLVLDIGKGYLAVWIAQRVCGCTLLMSAAAVTVMAGHAYPIFLRFKGGKAVATFVGAFLCLTPWALAAEVLVFVGVVVWTRHISVGSIVGAATFPLAVWLIQKSPLEVLAAALIGGAFIIYKHRSNIERLRAGTENVFKL